MMPLPPDHPAQHRAGCMEGECSGCATTSTAATAAAAWDHPAHYGGKDNPHEAIKCIDAHGLGFSLGNAVKYIFRAGHKVNHTLGQGEDNAKLEDLKKARWYIDHEIERLEKAARGED